MISEVVGSLGSYKNLWLNRDGQGADTEETQTRNLFSGAIVIGDLPFVRVLSLTGKVSDVFDIS